VLAQVARRLRQDGEAFRIGGDEFALLLPGHDEQEAVVVADGDAPARRRGGRG
jgi:GGDEF domain-containing protein